MDNVLTVVAPGADGVSGKTAADVSDALRDLGAEPRAAEWLAPEQAFDILYAGSAGGIGPATAEVTAGLEDLSTALGVDIAAQAAATRRKDLLIADMDSTMITGETLDELADYAGLGQEVAAITERAMRGEILFRDALAERVAMLEGLAAETMVAVADAIIYSPGAEALVRTMSVAGAKTALVSGGFGFFTERVAAHLGFAFNKGNRIEIAEGRLTGRVVPPIVTKDVKRDILIDIASWNAIPLARTLAVGDGANDVPMIRRAGLGVAYRGKPALRDAADAIVSHCDLTALLYFQGYGLEAISS